MAVQSSTSTTLSPQSREAQKKLRAILDSMGVTMYERNILYALAWCESNFDWNISGDNGYSYGIFQSEREPGISPEIQTQNAVARLRRSTDALAGATALNDRVAKIDGSVVAVKVRSVSDRIRILRADWQLPEGWITKWLKAVEAIVQGLEQFDQASKSGDAAARATGETMRSVQLGLLNKGGGLSVDAMIGWLAGQGAGISADALKAGQSALEMRLGASNVNWDPVMALDGGYGAGAGQQKGFFGWGYDQLSGAVGAMGRITGGLAQGAEAISTGAGNFLSVAMPIGGVILGGGLAVWLLSRMFGKGRR